MTEKRITWKSIVEIFKQTGQNFVANSVPQLAGSLAYATIFSLAPLFLIIITVAGKILGPSAAEGKIFEELKDILGAETAQQIQSMIANVWQHGGGSIWSTILGVIVLIVGATSVFGEIQRSINHIWSIRPNPKRGWVRMLKIRALSFSLIITMGFLMLVSFLISALINQISTLLIEQFPGVTPLIFEVINIVLTITVITALIAVIFKFLPDARIKWRDVMTGALATTFLFIIGRFGISYYLSTSNVGNVFGAAASLVLLLMWIYYSALILYFGAQFTKTWAIYFGKKIYPSSNAVSVRTIEVEQENEPLAYKSTLKVEPTDAPLLQTIEEEIKDNFTHKELGIAESKSNTRTTSKKSNSAGDWLALAGLVLVSNFIKRRRRIGR